MARRPRLSFVLAVACIALCATAASAEEPEVNAPETPSSWSEAFDLSIEIDSVDRLSVPTRARPVTDVASIETLGGYIDAPAIDLGPRELTEIVVESLTRSEVFERETLAEEEGSEGPANLSWYRHPRRRAWTGEVDDVVDVRDPEAERKQAVAELAAELKAPPPRNRAVLEALPTGGAVLRDVEQAREVVLAGVTRLDGPLVIEGMPLLEHLSLPDLESVDSLDITRNPALQRIEAPKLRRVAGDLRVTTNAALTGLDLRRLATVDGELTIGGNPSLSHLALPTLTTVESLAIEDNPRMSHCEATQLSTATGAVRITGNAGLTELSLDALVTVLGDIDVLDNGALAVLEMTALEDVHGALTVALNERLERLTAERLTRVGRGLSLVANDTLAAMALTSLRAVGQLEIEDNRALPADSVLALEAALAP